MAKGLTVLKVQKAKPASKTYRLKDGEQKGLYLQVKPTGSRQWLFRYEIGGRERFMGLGGVGDFTLAEARERARKFRQSLLDGIDPIEQRKQAKDRDAKAEREAMIFKLAVDKFLAAHEDGWKNAKHRQQWKNTLRDYAYPLLGSRPISSIDNALINQAIADLWTTRRETARRVQQRVERVCQWVRDGMPLPKGTNGNGKQNQPSLDWRALPEFMIELRKLDSISARALEFTILTASRTQSIMAARWGEIDFKARVWTVPEESMKMGRPHRVALSTQAVTLLQALPREHGNDHIFIGAKPGAGLSQSAMAELAKGMHQARRRADLPAWVDPKSNRLCVVHGFRSTFRTWGAECAHYPPFVIEAALAHLSGDRIEQAYQRGDVLEKRFALMQDWADYADKPAARVLELHEDRKGARA